MTKAKTKGQKRNSKRGRPCKSDAARTKSGRISYARTGQEAPDLLARRKRVEMFGVTMEAAADKESGSVIGRMKRSQEISVVQHDALQRYFEMNERYFSSIQAPDSLKSRSGGSSMSFPDAEADERLAEKWNKAREAVLKENQNHRGNLLAALQFIVVKDEFHEHMIGDVRIAANALVRHYQIN